MSFPLTPIGHIKSMFHSKNGTPRQSGLIKSAKASLTINKTVFNNPSHSLDDLTSFSHVWIIWVFHANGGAAVKAKVAPPRLKGRRVGVFSTRSPHRPCPIGLTLARLEGVKGDTVNLSGIDLIDGTPVLDIKPYIPQYDCVWDNDKDLVCEETDSVGDVVCGEVSEDGELRTNEFVKKEVREETTVTSGCDESVIEEVDNFSADCHKQKKVANKGEDRDKRDETKSDSVNVRVPDWVGDPKDDLVVGFTERALKDLEAVDEARLEWLESRHQLKNAITEVLVQDPRSVYRKHQCSDRLYYAEVDTAHVTAWFDDRVNIVEVLRIKYKNDLGENIM